MSYEDIINLPHHVSSVHPQMSMLERAAQFSPFAALTGYDSAIKETARLTDVKAMLDNTELLIINSTIEEALESKKEVSLTFFVKDERKAEGGRYEVVSGYIKKIDSYEGKLILENYTDIPLEDIIRAEIKEKHPED